MLPETVDGLPDFVDGEGAFFQLPPLGVVEDLLEAVDFGLGVRVQCVLGGRVLSEEAVLGGLEHCGWVFGGGAVLLSNPGDGAVAGVGHGVVEFADGLVGEFMLRIPLVFLGDALLPVDVRPLVGCAGRGLWPCDIATRPVCRAVGASRGGVVGLGLHPLGGWGEGWGW